MFDPKEPELSALFRYWEDKRGSRALPARADIDPIDIPELLPHLVLVDTAPTLDQFRYRLFGTEVAKGFGHDRTGRRFAELPRLDNFDDVYRGYWLSYAERAPQYFSGQIVSEEKSFIKYSRLTLPLSRDGAQVDMLLGGVIFYFDS